MEVICEHAILSIEMPSRFPLIGIAPGTVTNKVAVSRKELEKGKEGL